MEDEIRKAQSKAVRLVDGEVPGAEDDVQVPEAARATPGCDSGDVRSESATESEADVDEPEIPVARRQGRDSRVMSGVQSSPMSPFMASVFCPSCTHEVEAFVTGSDLRYRSTPEVERMRRALLHMYPNSFSHRAGIGKRDRGSG